MAKLLEFDEGNTQIISLYIPHIHCSSCIWVLENLQRLHEGVIHALVDFPKKTVRISYQKDKITLKELVVLLSKIGYAPYISLDDYSQKKDKKGQKQLLYKLGVAGFAFGNIGLLSFPGFFEDNEFWFNRYKDFLPLADVCLLPTCHVLCGHGLFCLRLQGDSQSLSYH